MSVMIMILPNQFLGGTIPSKPTETGPDIPIISIKTLKPIKPLDTSKLPQPIEEVQPIATPPPVVEAPPAAPVSSGCTTYWSGDVYLDNIIRFESGGNSCATNPGGCFGLLQACPGEPLRAACGGNPSCQIAWFQANKTGGRSWAQVWQHELAYGWW